MGTDQPSDTLEPTRYRIANATIDVGAGRVLVHGQELTLPPLSFRFLQMLVSRAPNIVTTDELMAEVWAGTVVNDETVTQRAKLLRDALATVDSDTTYIETVRGRGYRLAPAAEPLTNTHAGGDAGHGVLAWLYERRIPQTAGAYAVVAWVVLQLADIVIQQLELPPWVFRSLLVVLGVGFPLVIVAATVVGTSRKSGGSLRTRRVGVVAMTLAVVLAASAWWGATDIGNGRSQPASGALPGIAVLPFKDLSPEGDKAYFSDGIHDELLNKLSATGAFQVPSRTTMERFRNSDKKTTAIASDLGVAAVLEGSVRHAGDRVRVTVQLIDGLTDNHLWSNNYDRLVSVEELFAIQSDIAVAIARVLEARLGTEQARALAGSPTQSLEAYDAVLKARYYGRRYNPQDLQRAVAHYERATELDASFAEAWSGLANTYALAATSYGWLEPARAMALARQYGEKALQLDPNLATVMSLMGDIKFWFERDWRGAEAEYLRAIATDPKAVGNRLSYAYLLSTLNRHDEALGQIFQCLEMEPRSPRIHANAAWRYVNARQYERAIEHATTALKLDPTMADARNSRGYARVFSGDLDGALEDAGASGFPELVGFTLAAMGRTDEARAELLKLQNLSNSFVPYPASLAVVHTALGDFDAAFAQLELALSSRHRAILQLDAWEVYDPLRADPRFELLLQRVFEPLASSENTP